ncbi:hypothetical protein Hanom_Chr14g01271251 [Helianthus anomalus]
MLCGIQVMGEYGWCWFILDRMRGFTDFTSAVPSGGWMLGFHASGRAKGLAAVEESTLATTPGDKVISTSFLTVQNKVEEKNKKKIATRINISLVDELNVSFKISHVW